MALVVVLGLAVLAFLLAAGEARAQQTWPQHFPEQTAEEATGREAGGPAVNFPPEETVLKMALPEKPPVEALPTATSPTGALPIKAAPINVPSGEGTETPAETTQPGPFAQPDPAAGRPTRHGPESSSDPTAPAYGPVPDLPNDTRPVAGQGSSKLDALLTANRARTAGPYAGPQTGPSPETDVELATQALEPVLFEENAPLSPSTNEPPDSVPKVSEVITEEPYLLPDATRSYSSAMETFGNVAANVETVAGGPLQPAEVGGSLGEALASLFSGPETTRVPASKVVEEPSPLPPDPPSRWRVL